MNGAHTMDSFTYSQSGVVWCDKGARTNREGLISEGDDFDSCFYGVDAETATKVYVSYLIAGAWSEREGVVGVGVVACNVCLNIMTEYVGWGVASEYGANNTGKTHEMGFVGRHACALRDEVVLEGEAVTGQYLDSDNIELSEYVAVVTMLDSTYSRSRED